LEEEVLDWKRVNDYNSWDLVLVWLLNF